MLLVEKYNNIVIPDSVSSLELNDIYQKLIAEERKESLKKELPEQLKNNKFHQLAAVVNTREPVRRSVLEVSAFDLPELAAAIITKRPKVNIIEILLRSLYTSSATALNPKILSAVVNRLGKIFSPKEHHKNLLNIARFQREELESIENFKKGIERLEEEAEDQELMAGIATNQSHKEKHLNQAELIRNFKNSFEANEENLELAKKIKNLSILGDSIEGVIWGFD